MKSFGLVGDVLSLIPSYKVSMYSLIIRRRVSSLLAVNGSAVASGDHPAPTSSTSFTVDPQGSQQVRSLA